MCVADCLPVLQVAGAPGPFIAAVQTPDHATSMAQSPEDAAVSHEKRPRRGCGRYHFS